MLDEREPHERIEYQPPATFADRVLVAIFVVGVALSAAAGWFFVAR